MHARLPPRLALVLVVTSAAFLGAGFAVLASCGPSEPVPRAQRSREYVFTWSGDPADLPWNRSLFLLRIEGGKPQPPIGLHFFEGEDEARVEGVPGEKWFVHSEQYPTPQVARLLWTCRAEGVFGEETKIVVPLPRRATLQLTGDEGENAGDDEIGVTDRASGARLVAERTRHRGMRMALWDAAAAPDKDGWAFGDQLAPPSPWSFRELRPGGRFAVAARRRGRQWLLRDVDLVAGESVVLDVVAQPEGGGTVVADEPRTELLLGGEHPLPPLRLTEDFLRASWEGVPPGRHVARWPGGQTREFEVADGARVVLPKAPPGSK
jgi:hypothetical protein